MAKKKRTNPRKRVATPKNVEDDKQKATGNGEVTTWAEVVG